MATKRKWMVDARGLQTHQEIADKAKISRSTYSHIENGLRNPSVKTAKKIARALGVNWTLFFNENCGDKPLKPTGTDYK